MSIKSIGHARKRRQTGFVAAAAGTMIVAFAVTFWWPEISTKSQIFVFPRDATSTEKATTEAAPPDSSDRFYCQVTSVTDGDTLRCADGTRIRLHAVAARERDETCSAGHPCPSASGAAATSALRQLVDGRSITCEPTGRSYDRVTAICWTLEDVQVNCAMIQSGTAIVWERFNREKPICR